MALLLIGIDEAGLGPLLGPLCVGMSAFLVEDWQEGASKPCLWKLLARGVCRKPGDKRGRIAIADSKSLKLPNQESSRHPLTHLERGVLSCACSLAGVELPADDGALHRFLGAELRGHEWYEGPGVPLPVATSPGLLKIATNILGGALNEANVRILSMRCRVVNEREFNSIVQKTGNKAEVSFEALAAHMSFVREVMQAHPDASVRVVCDKLGGRDSYAPVLERFFPGWECDVVEQGAARSVYDVGPGRAKTNTQTVRFVFQPEAEDAHLPVALASMIAKYVRDLAMHRFNRYWSSRLPELKPTAGYRADARRWLEDASPVLTLELRTLLVLQA